jgi:hypothetical protein
MLVYELSSNSLVYPVIYVLEKNTDKLQRKSQENGITTNLNCHIRLSMRLFKFESMVSMIWGSMS